MGGERERVKLWRIYGLVNETKVERRMGKIKDSKAIN